MERRKNPRIHVCLPLELHFEDDVYLGETLDLSVGGACFEIPGAEATFVNEVACRVVVTLPSQEQVMIEATLLPKSLRQVRASFVDPGSPAFGRLVALLNTLAPRL